MLRACKVNFLERCKETSRLIQDSDSRGDGGSKLLRNVGNKLPIDKASYPSRLQSLSTTLCKHLTKKVCLTLTV
jgi:hypothetical protein